MLTFLIIAFVIISTAVYFFRDGYKRGYQEGRRDEQRNTLRNQPRQPDKEWDFKQHRTN